MLIDNLHRINSPSDLFMYICELEKEQEANNETLKQTAKKYLNTRKVLQMFLAKDQWCDIKYGIPLKGKDLEVYITAPQAEEDSAGVFEMAVYYPGEGFRLCEAYKEWQVRYWRYLGSEDSAG